MSYHRKKASWPELLGVPVEAVVTTVQSERPDITVEAIVAGAKKIPPGFLPKRVCAFFDPQDELKRVVAVPRVG
jgi:hypothetical protein